MSQASIHYTISLISKSQHLLHVNMTIKQVTGTSLTLCLPAWIPGSYMVRDFARNLHALRAHQNNDSQLECDVQQLDKQSWQIKTKNGEDLSDISVDYQIYAYDLSVRSAYINHDYAFFNGTSVFLYLDGFQDIAHTVSLDKASFDTLGEIGNARIATAMPVLEDAKNAENVANTFSSTNYHELIDHPFLLGQFNQHTFELRHTTFHIVFTGNHDYDLLRIERDLRPIIEHHLDLFGEIPCKEYWFITLICDGGFGGLEHIASTILQYNRFDIPMIGDNEEMSPGYQQFLSLCSHELFHTWHVKRIKPEVMHQVDLSKEVYTPQLWIYEGFTSLYDDLSLARSGIISPKDYVQVLNEVFTRLLKNSGRHKQSVSQSSFEAWSKFYKQDAGSVNHIVSYYNKGAVVALCLDITIRQQSHNKYNLDTLMQLLWQSYGKPQIGTPDNVIAQLCKQKLGLDLTSFLHVATQTTTDLPLQTLLQSIGLNMQLRPSQNMLDKGGDKPLLNKVDFGANIVVNDKLIKVSSVFDGRAASNAGLMVDDVIIAVNYWQCDEAKLLRLINQCDMGECIPLHVIRDGKLISLSFKICPAINDTCCISIANEKQFLDWLGLKSHTLPA